MSKRLQLIGETFGKLKVVECSGVRKQHAYWLCHCECGTRDFVVAGTNLVRGLTKSCGCISRKHGFSHGKDKTGTYASWRSMLERCNNVRGKDWSNWGGRGISVCEAWEKDFMTFLNDMGVKPKGLTLDRINNDGNYEPSNCRWATAEQQARNTRATKLDMHKANRIREFLWAGFSKADLADFYGISKWSIYKIARHQRWSEIQNDP